MNLEQSCDYVSTKWGSRLNLLKHINLSFVEWYI